jgi:hypothetical protein
MVINKVINNLFVDLKKCCNNPPFQMVWHSYFLARRKNGARKGGGRKNFLNNMKCMDMKVKA